MKCTLTFWGGLQYWWEIPIASNGYISNFPLSAAIEQERDPQKLMGLSFTSQQFAILSCWRKTKKKHHLLPHQTRICCNGLGLDNLQRARGLFELKCYIQWVARILNLSKINFVNSCKHFKLMGKCTIHV